MHICTKSTAMTPHFSLKYWFSYISRVQITFEIENRAKIECWTAIFVLILFIKSCHVLLRYQLHTSLYCYRQVTSTKHNHQNIVITLFSSTQWLSYISRIQIWIWLENVYKIDYLSEFWVRTIFTQKLQDFLKSINILCPHFFLPLKSIAIWTKTLAMTTTFSLKHLLPIFSELKFRIKLIIQLEMEYFPHLFWNNTFYPQNTVLCQLILFW